ncbi:ARM repeat superfamily protein isoform X2 [Tasmannia lanceolata]|uniref:ARM repeat superfamily protein isoform X2 n=1 Tax=Tasmannia lanceolata TaxID=3420 RepID=UPI004062E8EA
MEEHIRESRLDSVSSSSHPGRVISVLLNSRPRQLESVLSRVGSTSHRTSEVLLDESICFIRYVRDAVEKREPLDQFLIPMIENSLKLHGSKHRKQVLVLLNWLFQDELLFQPISSNLIEVLMRKEDNYIALGWCTLIRDLVDHELATNQLSDAGKQEKRNTLLKILFQSISHLSSIMCKGSILKDGFELPTRLAVAASDCALALTEALTQKAPISEKERSINSRSPQGSGEMEMELLLWDHLDELTFLVQKLQAWSRKSRPLHATGLEQVLKWLQDIRGHYGSRKDEAGRKILKAGVSLLSSCWKHYGMLLRLEDQRFSQQYMEMLNQYISAIQFYSKDNIDEHPGKKNGGVETKKFFLNCISLLWGRLDNKQLEIAMSESGQQISDLLLSQLLCSDEDVIEQAVAILRAIMFKTNFSSPGNCILDYRQMEATLPSLLSLLDERDSTARAVVLLTAEYCSVNPDGCLQEIFKRLDCGNYCQRRNAIDVIAELIHIASDSKNILSPSVRQDIAKHLLQRLGDDEVLIRARASNLVAQIDPSLVLPTLVHLVYSPDERVQSSARDSVVAVLKSHNQNSDVIVMLLDCLSNISQSPGLTKTPGETGKAVPFDAMTLQSGSKLDLDQVFKLVPKWAESVQDWTIMIESLIDKMFADPSNAIIVRFLSNISEHLAEAKDVVLHQVLLHVKEQTEMDENWFLRTADGTSTSGVSIKLKDTLFNRLCPLLIIRLLPLRIFNDLNSSVMYGQLISQDTLCEITSEKKGFIINNHDCIAALLVNRAFHLFEFEDVRKLAVELCGRLHPQVLLPIIGSQLDDAIHTRDILKLKACLFAVCTSLVVRGKETAMHPVMVKIGQILETVLLWPSLDSDEVSKAQHGCIDCLALMICAQLQAPEPSNASTSNKISTIREERSRSGDTTSRSSVLNYVIQRLTCDWNGIPSSKSDESECLSEAPIPLMFRICMANVLISACQKISSSTKHLFASRALPVLIPSVEAIPDLEVRAACLQVLFSAVYHLKSAVLPHSCDLFKLSLKALRKGSEKEKIAGAKLMASLMASEDAIIESISAGLLEAKSVLLGISLKDSSSELRQLCEKLLVCITSPLDMSFNPLSSK